MDRCVLFCVTGTKPEFFEKGFLRALHSLRRTNPHLPVVVFFDELSTVQKQQVDGCDLRQVDPTPFSAGHRDDLTRATFFRFYLGQELGDVSRVLYLDADLVVLDNLDAVFETDAPLTAVAKVPPGAEGEYREPAAIAAGEGLIDWCPIFNAGVLCFDGPYWARANLLDRSLDLVAAYGWDMFLNCDQGILNVLANVLDGYSELHPRFNFWPAVSPRARLTRNDVGLLAPVISGRTAAIVHWVGPKKPWKQRSTWWSRLNPRLYRVTADACYHQWTTVEERGTAGN